MSPETMASLLDLAQKLSGASLAAILIAILIGNFKDVWIWGKQLVKREAEWAEAAAEWAARLKKAEEEGARWQAMALQAAGMSKTLVDIVTKSQG